MRPLHSRNAKNKLIARDAESYFPLLNQMIVHDDSHFKRDMWPAPDGQQSRIFCDPHHQNALKR